VEPLLDLADDLEHRDAVAARALADVEALQAEVEEVRSRSDAAGRFLAALPALSAEREREVELAVLARDAAAAAVRDAERQTADAKKESARLEAERARAAAAEELARSERGLAEAEAARDALHGEAAAQRAEAGRLQERAAALAPRVRDVPPPQAGLEGTHEWASQARGALLLERSQLAREREAVIREASELVASVTGEPFTSAAVAGTRDRLALALRGPSA
jgi:hypothetical protein